MRFQREKIEAFLCGWKWVICQQCQNAVSSTGRDDGAPWREGWWRCQPPVTRGHVWGKKCQSNPISGLTWVKGKPGSHQNASLEIKETCYLPLSGENWCTQHSQRQFRALIPKGICTYKAVGGQPLGEKKKRGKTEFGGTDRRDFWARTYLRALKIYPFDEYFFSTQLLSLGGTWVHISWN